MRRLNGVYTRNLIASMGMLDTFLQGRYKVILAGKDSYLLGILQVGGFEPHSCRHDISDRYWRDYPATTRASRIATMVVTALAISGISSNHIWAMMRYIDFARAGVRLASV